MQRGLPRNETGWEWETVDLRMMQYAVYEVLSEYCTLYSAYAVLGVNSSSWHGEIERDELTWCS